MFTTNPWAVYVYVAGPVITGYYLFAVFRFYGREIKAKLNTRTPLSRRPVQPSEVSTGHSQYAEPPESGLAEDAPPQPGSSKHSTLMSPKKGRELPGQQQDLSEHLKALIEEAHEKDYDKQELILLLQMTIKDYLDLESTQFQSAISKLIGNECAKYGSIHLGEQEIAAIWNKV